MTYLDSSVKSDCSGCGACCQVCPKGAIRMVLDEEGFLYPFIDNSNCVNCNKCRKVCPSTENGTFSVPIEIYAGYTLNGDKRRSSASGGAFYAIVAASSVDTLFVGAEWKSRSEVVHNIRSSATAYESFRKSKYVQSNIGDTYVKVKELLQLGKEVIFTGTPCQVAGLKKYLGFPFENLICIDLVCHGTSSSLLLEKYLMEQDLRNNPIISISFREKRVRNSKWESKLIRLLYKSGKVRVLDYDHSSFQRAYDCGLIFRPSCSVCPYARKERISDITLGDYWGGENDGFDPHQGVSLIIVNSKKGFDLVEKIENGMFLKSVDYNYAVSKNGRLRVPDRGNKYRTQFFKNLNNIPFTNNVNLYAPAVPAWKKIAHKLLKG